MNLDVAVFGAGSIGRRHHENLITLGANSVLVPWRSVSSMAAWLSDHGAPDAAVIATSTHIRADAIGPLAAAGVPLYVEKPVAVTASELETVTQLMAPIADRSVAGFMMRYHPLIRALAVDRPNSFRADFEIGHDVTQWRENWTFQGSYAADPRGGGVLLDLCHELDLALTLFPGMTVGNVTAMNHADYPQIDFATRIDLDGDAQVCVAMDYLSPLFNRTIRFRGVDHSFQVDLLSGQVLGQGPTLPMPDAFERNDMFLGIMADFLRLVRGDAPENPICPRFDHALKSCQAISQAWAKRRFIGQIEKDI